MADLQPLKQKIIDTLFYLEKEYLSINNCGKEDKQEVNGRTYLVKTCSYSNEELQAAKEYAIEQFTENFDEVVFDFDLTDGEDVTPEFKTFTMDLVNKYAGK